MMKQEDLLKKTGAILNELQEQYQFMSADPQQISELELELFLANANFLSEHVQILKKISSFHPVKALPEHAQPSLDDSNAGETKVFDDFFTPDKETPTFEFIVNERREEPQLVAGSASQVIDPSPPEEDGDDDYPEKELYEIEEPEEEPYEQAPVEEPVEEPKPASRYVHPVYSNMDISSIPPEQIAHDEPVAESGPVEEEDEVGPEPFLVAQEPAGRFAAAPTPEPVPTPVAAAVPEPVIPVFTTPSQPATPAAAVSPAIEPVAEPARTYTDTERPYAEPAKPASVQPAAAPTHQPTLNELLAASRQRINARPEQETSKPVIQDLKRAISLNEKLLFVKDLFDGYNLAYAEAIDLLNKMPDFQTADAFLQKHYATKHNWAAKQSTADQFYELLHQRFPK
jgi:hypothetical protein